MKISNLSITIFCHETEDKNKIINALNSFFGNLLDSASVYEQKVEGHYGNSIEIIEYKASGKKAEEISKKIFYSFDVADLLLLLSTFDDRSEGNKLHLRIDKQRLIAEGKISLKDGDDIIKVVVTAKNINELKDELKELASRNLRN